MQIIRDTFLKNVQQNLQQIFQNKVPYFCKVDAKKAFVQKDCSYSPKNRNIDGIPSVKDTLLRKTVLFVRIYHTTYKSLEKTIYKRLQKYVNINTQISSKIEMLEKKISKDVLVLKGTDLFRRHEYKVY